MTALVVPFRPVVGPFVVAQRERVEAAAWCALRGAAWGVEAICAEDGAVALGIVSPGSVEDVQGAPLVAWIVERCAAGLAVVRAATFEVVGVFPSLGAALRAVEGAEGAAANDA